VGTLSSIRKGREREIQETDVREDTGSEGTWSEEKRSELFEGGGKGKRAEDGKTKLAVKKSSGGTAT